MSGHPKNSQSWSESEKEWFAEEHGTFQDADEWEGYNFSLSEAIEWARWHVEPGDAKRYRKNGTLSPPEYGLKYAGIEVEEAIQWEKLGFNLYETVCWFCWDVDPKTAAQYRDKGIVEAPEDEFRDEGLTLEETFKWFDEGFECFDDAVGWIEWKVSPKNAKKYKDAGKEPPDEEFLEVGISLANAVKWLEQGFHSSEYGDPQDEDENYWKNWYDAGLTPSTACRVRDKLVELAATGAYGARGTFLDHHGYELPGSELQQRRLDVLRQALQTLPELTQARVPISAENLIKWRNFKVKGILDAIDHGVEPEDAHKLISREIPLNQVDLYEKIKLYEIRRGSTEREASSTAAELIYRGVSAQQLNLFIRKDLDLSRILWVMDLDKLKISTVAKWAKAGWQVDASGWDKNSKRVPPEFVSWISTKLDPTTAYLWKSNNFTPEVVQDWLGAGVTDPEIAKRRTNAGIHPKS